MGLLGSQKETATPVLTVSGRGQPSPVSVPAEGATELYGQRADPLADGVGDDVGAMSVGKWRSLVAAAERAERLDVERQQVVHDWATATPTSPNPLRICARQ